MVPGTYNIKIYKGSTWSITLEARDALDASMDFSVYDSMRMQIRAPWIKGIPVGAPLLELTSENGRISLQSDDTQILLVLSAAITADLTFKEGVYDLELVKDAVLDPPTAEVVDKLIRGSVTVIGEPTV